MIKILNVIETISQGGAEHNLLNITKYMHPGFFSNKVISLYPLSGLEPEFKKIGVSTSCLGMSNIFDFRKGIININAEIKKRKPDIISTQLFGANLYGRLGAYLNKVPVVTILQNPDYTHDRGAFFSDIRRRLFDKLTINLAKPKFIAVSEYVKWSYVKELSLNPEDIEIVYNSLDLDKFKDVPALNSGELKSVSGDGGYILNVGRLHPQKGQEYLLRAFKKLGELDKGINLVIIGQGPLENKLKILSKDLGIDKNVIFLGKKENVLSYMKHAKAFVFPSLYEGLPLGLLEAMAMGLPVVASNIPPIKEIDGKTGAILMFSVKDELSLVNSMRVVLEDKKLGSDMSGKGLRIIGEKYDAKKNSAKVENYFKRILKLK